jgi:mono/diheme cytochrome c family protein
MTVRRPFRWFLLLAALPAAPGGGALAADAAHGRTIAERWCASCHLVTSGQKTASADVPSFADVATRRTDAKALRNFLVDPHPKMPNMHLSRREIDDIVAYIRSLDPRPSPPEPGVDHEQRPKNG